MSDPSSRTFGIDSPFRRNTLWQRTGAFWCKRKALGGKRNTSSPRPHLLRHCQRELPSWFAGVDEGYDRYSLSIDSYSLQAGNIRRNVPGPDVCVDGDQLRIKEPLPITQIVTDNSKCYMIMKGGDREVRFCPSESRSEAILYEGHLSSPLTYSVNVCLEYDDSNCKIYWKDDKEKKICWRHDFEYKGVWAAGTLTKYKCTKWETRTRSHPLQYRIRYMIPYRLNDRVTKCTA